MRIFILKFAVVIFALCSATAQELAEYVAKKDDNYSWTVIDAEKHEEGTIFTLHMVSQKWLTETEVDHPLWEPRMAVYVPAEGKNETALLMIS